MTPAKRLQLEQSEKREAINALLDKGDLSDEQRGELDTLTKRAQQIEVELRAALVAEPEPSTTVVDNGDAEQREFRALRGKVKLHKYIAAAMENRSADGAEREYAEALGLTGGQVPLSMFAPPEVRKADDPETRTTTDTDSTTTPRPWVDRLFADTAAAGLGLTFESVAPGVASHPITTAGGTPAQRGREEATDVGAWTVGVTEVKPSRMSIHYNFAIEDAARLPGLESALRRDMGMAMRERMDFAIFAGDDGASGTDADIAAIGDTTGITAKTLTQSNKVKYDKTLEAFVDLLDGIHAESLGDLNVVAYVGANKLWRSTIANNTAGKRHHRPIPDGERAVVAHARGRRRRDHQRQGRRHDRPGARHGGRGRGRDLGRGDADPGPIHGRKQGAGATHALRFVEFRNRPGIQFRQALVRDVRPSWNAALPAPSFEPRAGA